MHDGIELPDPTPNLALSALGLAFNVIANGLLVFRFSARIAWWKTAMILSTVCWVIKVNSLAQYLLRRHHTDTWPLHALTNATEHYCNGQLGSVRALVLRP